MSPPGQHALRELRVVTYSAQADNGQATIIGCKVAKVSERESTYPGDVKITVVRESRFIETAH